MQYQPLDEELPVGGPSASESGGRPYLPDLNIQQRYHSKLLRALARKHDIVSTKSLVAAYNATTDENERSVLLVWLREYGQRSDECLEANAVLEFVELAKIAPVFEQDADILRQLVYALHSRIRPDEFLDEFTAKALLSALTWVNPTVYDAEQLTDLTFALVSSLSSVPTLTKQNFLEYEANFLGLHQAFFLLHSIGRGDLLEEEKNMFRIVVAQKKEEMELSSTYCPVSFHFEIIQQAVERIETEDSPSDLAQVTRQYVRGGVRSLTHIFHVLRNVVNFDIEPEAIEDGQSKPSRRLRATMGTLARGWYDVLQILTSARILAVNEKTSDLSALTYCYDATIEEQRKTRKKSDQKALRFGIIQEMRLLASSKDSSDDLCKDATRKLVDLATSQAILENWIDDADILTAILDALYEIHSVGDQNEEAANALRKIQQSSDKRGERTLTNWLDGKTMEEKLQMQRPEVTNEKHEDMFTKIGADIGYLNPSIIRSNIENLKRTYLHDNFATVPSLFEPGVRRHVRDMKHHIVTYEEIIEKRVERGEELQGEIEGEETKVERSTAYERDDLRVYHHKQKGRVAMSVAIEDVFTLRSFKANVGESTIRKALLYGNPGSGKTCLSKIIAHKWARGEMAQEFDAVYVVPLDHITAAKSNDLQGETLEDVITRVCFKKKRNDAEHKDTLTQVDDDLDMPTTLLIFDGLDEADDDARELVSVAAERSCKLLILTRPYNSQWIQTRVNIEFECLGFNDQQLRNYISAQLCEDEARRLIDSVRRRTALWEMAHIPVMAEALCFLSKERAIATEKRRNKASIFRVYKDITSLVWKKLAEEPGERMAIKMVLFEDLEKIAFEALQKEQIIIERRIIDSCTATRYVSKHIEESGFLLLASEGQDYQFPHLTLQEYFAAQYIAKCLRRKKPDEEKKVRDFIDRGKYDQRKDLTISMSMHALAEEGQGINVLHHMLSIIDSQPVEVLGMQHFFLKMRVLEATLEEADEDDSGDLVKDEQAIELAKGARRLLNCTIDHSLALEIVTERFEECSHVLEAFSNILHDAMEETKDLLVSAKNLSEGDNAKIRNVLKLMKHTPEYNDNIIQLFFLLLNGSGEGCSFEERMKRLALIASEAPHLASNLVPMLEKGCTSPDFFMRKNTIATIEKFMGAVPRLADDLLQMLARGCDDEVEYVRTNAIKAIGNVAKTASQFADLLPMLERTFNDESSYVRRNATEAIRLIVRETPHLADDLLPMLTKGCNDGVEYVRADAIKAVGDVIGAAPHLADKLLPVLTRRGSEDVEYVRADAIKAVGDVVRAAPHLVDKLLPALESWSKDENCKVRISAIDAIGSVAGSAPHLAEDFFSIVKKWVDDKHFYVRGKSMLAIGSIVKAAFHLAEDFLPTLKKGCSDKAGYVRWNAIKAIGSVIRATPELAHDLLPVLEIARGDEVAYVRCDAMEAIGHIASVAPDVVIDLLPMLQIRCSHKSYSVRGNAMEDIGRIFKKAPHFADDFLLMLERGSEDNAFFVRQKALEAIQSVVMQAPHLVDKILPMVEKGCNDNCTVVCKTARTLLKSMEPEKVIPLTVSPLQDRTIEGGKVSFVLHTTSSELVGEWDKETVDKYLEWLGQEFDKEFPGVLKHLGQANNKLTPYFFSTCVNTMIEVVSAFIEFPYILFILHLLEWCIKLFSLFEQMD